MKSDFHFECGTIECVIQRLADEAGIDPASLEPSRIKWTIERRCSRLGIPDPQGYVAQLDSSRAELDNLIDALVIQETSFFRDPQVFDHLRTWAQEMVAACSGPLRILSAPCSTGQEAYSLAAVLLCAGVPLTAFSIDAFDISPSALAVARKGVYSAGALEHAPAELQSACGTLRDRHWEMHEQLRSNIRFERRNLAKAGAIDSAATYHLILCRNLFIYLHTPARAALAAMLSKALVPGGQLVVGAGDRVAEINALFAPLKPAAGFGLTHRRAPSVPFSAPVLALAPARARVVFSQKPAVKDTPTAATADDFYRRAVDCLQRGNTRQAERRCRQALYLAPAYLPALEMLQRLWHLHPNPRIKRALNARIERVGIERARIDPPNIEPVRIENSQAFAVHRQPQGGEA